jgi:hypothetical protein
VLTQPQVLPQVFPHVLAQVSHAVPPSQEKTSVGGAERAAIVHTYSSRPSAPARVAFVTGAMVVLGGLVRVEDAPGAVRFPCAGWHEAAIRRVFLEACKTDPALPVEPRALAARDRRTDQEIHVEPLGDGLYRLHADGAAADEPSRAPAAANGLAKLAELVPEDDDTVLFPCRSDHHALVGLLLPRALNVRAVLREEEAAAARGVLVAPSSQEGAMTP